MGGSPGRARDRLIYKHEFRAWTHTVNEQNETRLIETSEGDQANPSPTPAQNWVRRDANGNVISNGTYHYQYDAWNRLIQAE